MDALGLKIKELRKAKNLSQQDLATKSGVLKATIAFIEIGKYKNPATDKIQKIAIALEVSPDELMKLAGYPVIEKPEIDKIKQDLKNSIELAQNALNNLNKL